MWYNSTDGKLRGIGIVEAFSSASPIITAAVKGAGFGPVGGPNIMFGGVTPPSTYVNTQIEYNGSGWASDGTYPQSLQGVGVTGVSTAAISVGGNNNGPPSFPSGVYNGPALEYNGSSWTSAPAYPVTSITQIANAGTETAAVFAGGYTYDPGSYTTVTNTNEYNGSSFSSGNAVNTGRQTTVSAGTQTAAIMVGGDIWTSPSATATSNATEQYDGTSWTSVSNHPKSFSGNGFNSKSENTIINGAIPGGPDSTVFKYDGSSWSTIPGLATGRYQAASGTGSPTNVLCVSGRNPGWVTTVEEYNKSTNTVTAAAWASGGSLNTARRSLFTGPMGTQTAGLAAGGTFGPPGRSNATEEYNGSSWTSVNNTTDTLSGRGSAGTQTAGLLFSGNPSPATVADTEEYDGTNWTAGGALNNARGYGPIAAGTQTAALCAGGYNPPVTYVTVTEYYNGTAWTAQPNANPNNYAGASGGTQGAAWFVGGGAVSPAPVNTEAYNWNGTSWSASGNYIADSVVNMFGGGTQTAGWMCAGDADPGYKTATNHYDGTVWSTAPNVGTGRSGYAQGGTQTSGLICGGYTGSNTTATEEFTGETTAANIADFTTS